MKYIYGISGVLLALGGGYSSVSTISSGISSNETLKMKEFAGLLIPAVISFFAGIYLIKLAINYHNRSGGQQKKDKKFYKDILSLKKRENPLITQSPLFIRLYFFALGIPTLMFTNLILKNLSSTHYIKLILTISILTGLVYILLGIFVFRLIPRFHRILTYGLVLLCGINIVVLVITMSSKGKDTIFMNILFPVALTYYLIQNINYWSKSENPNSNPTPKT
jgi:hypothetical protein